jgi:hypothetical protein
MQTILSGNDSIEPRIDTNETRIRRDLQKDVPNGEWILAKLPAFCGSSVPIRVHFHCIVPAQHDREQGASH